MIFKTEGQSRALPEILRASLPLGVMLDIERISAKYSADIEEIRLRSDRRTEFIFLGTSIHGTNVILHSELQEIFYRLCGGSVYAHAENVCQGYIRAEGGIRIGVCGRAVISGRAVKAVHDISSINIRMPSRFLPDVRELSDTFQASGGGMLILSPPGVGKTTVLRSLARDLSGRCGKKTAVIDTRGELSSGLEGEELRTDILDGYPRGVGIEIAVRTMNPDLIICDEIGSSEEAEAILSVADCGVPVIASAHGSSAEKLICRKGIAELSRAGIFESYVLLSRSAGSRRCTYKITAAKDVSGGKDV